ncbi:hypothetical protein [Caulobacter sp. NIBR1757]|uniref:hypothetical protein n=1 Tax=Caulobacter sp. NIBR1757 TaxID=3016000 RepID=UPI0022F0EAE4|nr:hypothetical protein [Caulobacter sp. NIBR1757]WGM40308.1 hypothetical protein AMEJIAPC_03252 [Caulobacter sp. NIBR1757]
MQSLAPAYLSALATQLGGLSAFLGGFAATFLGTLLALGGRRRRTTGVAIGFAAAASAAFIVCVVASTALVAVLHPEAPQAARAIGTDGARVLLTLSFVLGLYTLLASLGLSGWSRSRSTGLTTSIAAGVGAVLATGLVLAMG